jgi:hypothetical protein
MEVAVLGANKVQRFPEEAQPPVYESDIVQMKCFRLLMYHGVPGVLVSPS